MSETARVDVLGDDAMSYLDSQCTQDLSGLATGDRVETLLLSPSGDLVTAARVTMLAANHLTFEIPSGTTDATIARLDRFAIRASVRFEPVEEIADAWLVDPLARIDAQIPGERELARGLVPHALDQGVRDRTVSFTKGCYPGQELVARMQARGATPPYVLRRCVLDGEVATGAAVGDPTKEGRLTSVALDHATSTWWALTVLHRRDAEADTVTVHAAVPALARFA